MIVIARIFAVNVEGTFYCCRAVVPLMRERNYGRIVNIASVAGKDGNPNASAYSASKAAVIALTKSLGKELADTSVRVNCVTPAAVRTPLFAQMTQAHIDYMLSKIPLGRLGEPMGITFPWEEHMAIHIRRRDFITLLGSAAASADRS
jgi:2-dehydro-3-deoxy-L-rhamnonate dehydrogenase (NAD+)